MLEGYEGSVHAYIAKVESACRDGVWQLTPQFISGDAWGELLYVV